MEAKKNPAISLQKEKPLFTLLGFIATCSIAFICLSFTHYSKAARANETKELEDPDLVIIPLIRSEEATAKPKAEQVRLLIEPITAEPTAGNPVQAPETEPSEPGESFGSETVVAVSDTEAIVEEVFELDALETLPEFPGGEAAMQAFIRSVLRFPEACLYYGESGTVVVNFIVEKDGSVSNVRLQNPPIGFDMDKEALRVVALMPRFKPGTFKKRPVRVQCSMPLEFILND